MSALVDGASNPGRTSSGYRFVKFWTTADTFNAALTPDEDFDDVNGQLQIRQFRRIDVLFHSSYFSEDVPREELRSHRKLLSDSLRRSVNTMEVFAQKDDERHNGWTGLPEITAFLRRGPPMLTQIHLDGFNGTVKKFCLLAKAIEVLPRLQSFTLLHAKIDNVGDNQACLDPIVTAVLNSRNIKEVVLGAWVKYVSLPTLCACFNSVSLQCLSLYDLKDDFNDTSIVALAGALRSSHLTGFSLRLDSGCMTTDRAAKALSEALRNIKTLEHIEINFLGHPPVKDLFIEILDGLGSSHIEDITIDGYLVPLCQRVEEALVRMARRNLFLKHVGTGLATLGSRLSDVQEKFYFYIRMNETRRSLFLGKGTTADWVAALTKASGRIDQLHYYLSCNPSLCCSSNVQQSTTRKRKLPYRAAKDKVSSYRYH